MSMQDPIADMLTRIRNALMAHKSEVQIPFSRLKEDVVKILQEEGYIRTYHAMGEGKDRMLVIALKYYKSKPVIEDIQRISRPGLRAYSRSDQIPLVRSGLGICILATSKGVMTDQQARALNVGGEILCTVF